MVHKVDSISSLDSTEFVRIVGNYNHILSASSDPTPDLEARGYSAEAIARVGNRKVNSFTPIVSMGLKFNTPLDHFKSELLSYALLLFENYERGQLPFHGSVSEQPSQIMEIFGLIQSLRAERDEKQRKKLEKENGRIKRQNQVRGR